jgi:hypothetical protein
MKILILPALALLFVWTLDACKSSSGLPSFCDTVCLKDSIKFDKEDNPLKPYVHISAKNCTGDTLEWSYADLGVARKMNLTDLVGAAVRINKDAISCFIKDTSYAWVSFNDCSNGRGYVLKIPFNKKENIARKSSALNRFDPKFSVAEGLVAYSDRGNIFVEDMTTGKQAMMTFGEKADIDYDAIHESIDTVNITASRVWAKVKLKEGWKEVEKSIELK